MTTGRKPEHISMDNGPESTSHALADWARFGSVGSVYIEPGASWENGYCESFNGRFRDEFLTTEAFGSLLEAQVLAEDWRTEYNTCRSHSALDDLTPEAFRRHWETTHQQLSWTLARKLGPRRVWQTRSVDRLLPIFADTVSAEENRDK